MAENYKGVQPLAFGTVVTTGYVTESITEDDTGKNTEIDDEIGDVVGDISAYGKKTSVNLEVMAKSTGATKPSPGDVFTYGPTGSEKKIIVRSISSKRVKATVMMWIITGERYPLIPLT